MPLGGFLLSSDGFDRDDRGGRVFYDGCSGDDNAGDPCGRGHFKHDRTKNFFEDRAEPARTGLSQDGEVGDRLERIVLKLERDTVELEHPLVLLDKRVLGCCEDVHERTLVERWEGGHNRQPSNKLRDESKLVQIFGKNLAEDVFLVAPVVQGGSKPDTALARPPGNDVLQPGKSTGDDEENVGRVDLDEFLVRMLPPSLGRHRGYGALQDLQECLLHPFTRDVPGDGGVLGLAGDLVDLINVDNARFGPFHVVVGGLQEFQEDVLDIFADVTRFGERGCGGNRKRHVKAPGKGLCEGSFAAPGGADKQDIGLRNLNVIVWMVDRGGRTLRTGALVVVVDRNGKRFLCGFLTDNVLFQKSEDFLWFGQLEVV